MSGIPVKRKASDSIDPSYRPPKAPGSIETYFDGVPASTRSDPFAYELAANGHARGPSISYEDEDDDGSSGVSPTTIGGGYGSPSMGVTTGAAAGPSKPGKAQPTDKERTGRACLACRKLKTRCDGADDPPCRRCRTGGHECIFVESKRGKRPAKKNASEVAEKFRTVEKTLGMVLQSIQGGQTPDAAMLQSLHAYTAAAASGSDDAVAAAARRLPTTAPSTNHPLAQTRPLAHAPPPPPSLATPYGRQRSPGSSTSTFQPSEQGTPATHFAPLAGPSNSAHADPVALLAARRAELSGPEAAYTKAGEALTTPAPSSHGMDMLASASLQAELDGRKGITPLDAHFRLSAITNALPMRGPSDHADRRPSIFDPLASQQPPALLVKRIIDPEMTVELFRIFFDLCYMHLPLLCPESNSATDVCARSSFLFTVICAVGARFHPDPDLESRCYEEAHLAFLNAIASGDSSLEACQACLILTVWSHAPKLAEDRPRLASLYFGMAVRLGLEIGLFRPPAFADKLPIANGAVITTGATSPWMAISHVPDEVQRAALDRERTYLLLFVIDRYAATTMGRPTMLPEVKSLLLPTHPLCLPFDLGIVAHVELQTIIGQVMDTFRDRIFGAAGATGDEVPSPIVIKLFTNRMDDWRARWCPQAGEPISNNLLFYFYNSRLYLLTIPLQAMLRHHGSGQHQVIGDPEWVTDTISSARAVLDLAHQFAVLGVLRHCPDVNFLFLLYAAVLLIKLKLLSPAFARLIDSDELADLIHQAIADCQAISSSPRTAPGTTVQCLRVVIASWRAKEMGTGSAGMRSRQSSITGTSIPAYAAPGPISFAPVFGTASSSGPAMDHTLAPAPGPPTAASTPAAVPAHAPFDTYFDAAHGSASHAQHGHPSSGSGMASHALFPPGRTGTTSGHQTPHHAFPTTPSGEASAHFLDDSSFFDSLLVSQGAGGFLPGLFRWSDTSVEADSASDHPRPGTGNGARDSH